MVDMSDQFDWFGMNETVQVSVVVSSQYSTHEKGKDNGISVVDPALPAVSRI